MTTSILFLSIVGDDVSPEPGRPEKRSPERGCVADQPQRGLSRNVQ
jgi:hypothetical protein